MSVVDTQAPDLNTTWPVPNVCTKMAPHSLHVDNYNFYKRKIYIDAYILLFNRKKLTHQNLNSGSLRMKGRNSSFCLVGNEGPSSERYSIG